MPKRPALTTTTARLHAALADADRVRPGGPFLYAEDAAGGVVFHDGLPGGALTVSRAGMALLLAEGRVELRAGPSRARPDAAPGAAQEFVLRS